MSAEKLHEANTRGGFCAATLVQSFEEKNSALHHATC